MRYYAGVDPSGGGADEFSWAICHLDGERVIVDLVGARGRKGRHPFDLDGAVAACCADLATYGIRACTGDRYAGAWVPEAFRRYGIHYQHSERPKSDLYLDLLPLVTMGRLELPDDPDLLKQLKLLERRRGSQGKDVIDHGHGGHDDRANAVALAVHALGPRAHATVKVETFRFTPTWSEVEAHMNQRYGGWEDPRGILEKVDDGYYDQPNRFDW